MTLMAALALIALIALFEDFTKRPLLLMFIARVILLFNKRSHVGYKQWRYVWLPQFINAMAVGDFVLVNARRPIAVTGGLYAHETEHQKQQRQYGSIAFALIYVFNFLFEYVKAVYKHGFTFKAYYAAYQRVAFERDALKAQHGWGWKPDV